MITGRGLAEGRPMDDSLAGNERAPSTSGRPLPSVQDAEALRALTDAVPAGMLVAGKDGKIQAVNELAATLFGYEPDELAGQQVELLVPERFRDDHVRHRAGYSVRPR